MRLLLLGLLAWQVGALLEDLRVADGASVVCELQLAIDHDGSGEETVYDLRYANTAEAIATAAHEFLEKAQPEVDGCETRMDWSSTSSKA